MMKKLFSLFILCLVANAVTAQVVTKAEDLFTPKDLFILGKKDVGHDSLASGNIVWITSNLNPHRHLTHSEHVYIIDGEADLMLGDKWFKVKNGDAVFIPKGTLHAVNVTSRRPLKVFAVQAPQSDDSDTIFR